MAPPTKAPQRLTLGMYVIPRGPRHGLDQLHRYEAIGLDTAWVGDTLGDWRWTEEPLLDAWPTLGAYATATSGIKLGMLISNVSWRRPVELARFAMTVDRLSQGRFTLGLGCGELDDQVMAGAAVLGMPARERVDRLEEAVTVIDRLLRGDVAAFDGRFSSYDAGAMAPGPVQKPRPPLLVAGNGRRVVRVAARAADIWNTYVDTDVDDFFERTRQRVLELDVFLDELGRGPQELRRSVLALDDAFDAWSEPGQVTAFVERFATLGFTDFAFYPPDDLTTLDHFARTELPALRGR